jgi:hypothetical protein
MSSVLEILELGDLQIRKKNLLYQLQRIDNELEKRENNKKFITVTSYPRQALLGEVEEDCSRNKEVTILSLSQDIDSTSITSVISLSRSNCNNIESPLESYVSSLLPISTEIRTLQKTPIDKVGIISSSVASDSNGSVSRQALIGPVALVTSNTKIKIKIKKKKEESS